MHCRFAPRTGPRSRRPNTRESAASPLAHPAVRGSAGANGGVLPGYLADHWCSKGHVLLCLEGELHTELQDGRVFTLTPGMSYQVADNAEPHRSYSELGARLFIVD